MEKRRPGRGQLHVSRPGQDVSRALCGGGLDHPAVHAAVVSFFCKGGRRRLGGRTFVRGAMTGWRRWEVYLVLWGVRGRDKEVERSAQGVKNEIHRGIRDMRWL